MDLMTTPERAVYNALLKLQIPFEFQSKLMGGREVKGGAIADFYLSDYGLVISVIGEYFHYGRPDVEARDMMQNISLSTQGINTIYIDAEDALRDARYYVEQALIGIDHSTYAGR